MTTIAISKFKATCLALIERVRVTGEPLIVTKRGVPVAQILPPPQRDTATESGYGAMEGEGWEIGDIVEPLPEEDWEALR